jgi:hypothetical protein
MNRYTSPAQDNYFNTFVPLPYQEIMATIASRQNQVERGQDAMDKMYEETQNLKYISGSPDEKYIRDYVTNVGNLVQENLNKDFSNPIINQQIRSKFKAMTNKQDIQNIQSSKAAWDINSKLRAQRKADGTYDEYYDKDPASNWDTVGSGKVYDFITPGRVNEQEVMDQYFNTPSITKGKTLSPRGDYNYHGATKDMTDAIADAKWQDFMNQPGIPRYIDKLMDQADMDKNDKKLRGQVAQEALRERGAAHTWDQQTGVTLDAQVRAARDKKDTPTAAPTIVTPYVPSTTEGVLPPGEKFNAKNVYKENESLTTQIAEESKLLDQSKKNNADKRYIDQQELNIQMLKDKQAVLKNTIDEATTTWDKQYKPKYEEAEAKFIEASERKGIPASVARKEYDNYATIMEMSRKSGLSWINPGSVNPMDLLQFPAGVIGDIAAYTKSIQENLIPNISTVLKMYPEFKETLKNELSREGQGIGQALKNTFIENKKIYQDFFRQPVENFESQFIGDKLRDDVIKYYNKTSYISKNKQKDINTDIETYGSKGIEKVRILAPTLSQDENNQMYYVTNDKNGAVKKVYNPMSTIMRQIAMSPEQYPLNQESSPIKDYNKAKNKEIGDIQGEIRNSSRLVPSEFNPRRNEDGTYDIYVDVFNKAKGQTQDTKTRKVRVRLTEPTQIDAASDMVYDSGHRVEAFRIKDPTMEKTLIQHKSDPSVMVEPFPGYGNYQVKKVNDKAWEIYDPKGTPILGFDNKPVGPIENFDSVIDYLYNVRVSLYERMSRPQPENNQ